MPKRFSHLFLVFSLAAVIAGCGLVGWQGDPPSPNRPLKIEGTMKSRILPDDRQVWTIETDTASYVPEESGSLPSAVRKDSLLVEVTGVVGGRPDFYPEGYFFDVVSITPLPD